MGFNNDEAIGKLIRGYSETKQQVAGLRSSIQDIVRDISSLARVLQTPEDVVSLGVVYLYDGASKTINHSFSEGLPELLKELQSTLEEKRKMEDCLRQAGLHGIID